MKSKMLSPWKESYDKPRQLIKKQKHHFADKGLYSQSYGFSSNHVQLWESDHKEGWLPNNWCFWIVVLEKTSESPLDNKEMKPVNPKGSQSQTFIGSTDAEADALVLWSPDAKSWLIRKDPDAERDRRQERRRVAEDEMVGWHHWLNGHEFEQTQGDNERQGSLACCSSWSGKELDTIYWLNNNDKSSAETQSSSPQVYGKKSWKVGGLLEYRASQVVLVVKNLPINTEYVGSILRLGRSLE